MSVPRPAAEIENGMTGADVLAGHARVMEVTGADVTWQFVAGARQALGFARAHDCAYALLIDGSPSCGSGFIYDGSFDGKRHAGNGVTAALLESEGIRVFSDRRIDELERLAG